MGRRKTSFRVTACVAAMVAISALWFAWWNDAWIRIVLLAIGIACAAAFIFAWTTMRRIDRALDRSGEATHGESDAQ